MTGTASVDAAPAHDTTNFEETSSATQPIREFVAENGHAHPQSLLPPLKTDELGDLSSGSELTPIKSDDDEPLLDESVPQTAPQDEDAEDARSGEVHNEDNLDDRPAKRRRVATPPPNPSKRKAPSISPPWKKFEAEGPTTFNEGGKRKSGRINRLPIDLQPQGAKRMTRGALHEPGGTISTKDKQAIPKTSGHVNGHRSNTSTAKGSSSKYCAPPSKSARRSQTNGTRTSPRTNRRRSPSPPAQTSPKRTSNKTRRSSRPVRESLDDSPDESRQAIQDSPNARPTRIRLRLRPPTIPLVHPAQVNVLPGQTIARPKLGENFADYILKAPSIDIKDGGWHDETDDSAAYTDAQAKRDARLIKRIEQEAQPGGLLSEQLCSVYVPEPAEEPPRLWAHADHVVKAMMNFRKLMLMEQQRHKQAAKRLAEACRDEWIRRQPKSAEQIEAEVRLVWIARYKIVVKAVIGTWENVKNEINRRRLEEWETAEQKRVKAALNEAVNMSEMKLQARRAHFDSELPSDEDEEDDEDLDMSDMEDEEVEEEMVSEDEPGSEIEIDGRDDIMSSSDDDDDAKSTASDFGLTQEELREKYANVPDLPTSDKMRNGVYEDQEQVVRSHLADGDDTSDESVDMDDDLGTSDEGMDSGDDDGSEADDGDSEEDDAPSGMLGLLFGKSELKKLREDAPPTTNGHSPELSNGVSEEIANGEELSLGTTPEHPPYHNKVTKQCDGVTQGLTDAIPLEPSSTDQLPIDPPSNPYEANKPDTMATIPGPLKPADVEMEMLNATELARQESSNKTSTTNVAEGTAAVPSVEVTAPPDATQTSPGTDITTNTASRDPSQSPRTTDSKPSDADTASSVIKSGVSRSTSPQAQVPSTEVPFLLRGNLREYQHYGLDWLAGLYQNKTNGILADEMGLGKTIQTIALLAHLAGHHEVWGPHLVIVPTSVMLNWEMEFKKWCPGFKVLSYYGSIEERKRKRHGWKTDDMWNVCITSYQIVLQDQQVFKRRQWHYMILDEAHNIKNFKSKRWQTLLGFNTRARLLLTGTPLQNNLTELWSLLFFLMPSENGVGGFADLAEFQDWFHKPESQILESGREQMDDEARAIIAKLHKVLRPYLLRRLKADVEKQMPGKYEHVEFCRLSRRQRELYDGFLARTDTREALASGNYISVINCLMQLRKVCNHPDLFVERPIMTSFRQYTSVIGEYASTNSLFKEKLLRENPMSTVSLSFLNFIPTEHEGLSKTACELVSHLSSHRALMDLREAQKTRSQAAYTNLDPSTVESNIVYLESAARWGRFEELQHCVYLNALRRQQRPIYGKRLRDALTIGVDERPYKPRPKVPAKIMAWFEEDSPVLRSMVYSLDQRSASMKSIISKFACITPAVVTRDMDRFVIGSEGVNAFNEVDLKLSAPVRYANAPFMPKEPPPDPWHEARMRLSIQFPDNRLLQYDCGKLQALDRLLRKLQSGGHRALIFTQMTKVLDILEQFLNIHGHKYLRLDGATKVEQRQILTDRFNNDPRILAFILSTRSGGLGINLTGADTVIFYDQDWNPAMDKQCQDRCHRIGQTRDVHIYRLVSEHTIEANILRKASQKQMLDDVVIQEGGFTTDYFNKLSVADVMRGVGDEAAADVAGDAMDRVLGGAESTGGGDRAVGKVLAQAEDREDVDAARVAEKEIQEDEADFDEKAPIVSASGTSSARQGTPTTREVSAAPGVGKSNLGLYDQSAEDVEIELNAWGERVKNIDDFMLGTMARLLEGTPLELPRDKKKGKSKKGKDTRKR